MTSSWWFGTALGTILGGVVAAAPSGTTSTPTVLPTAIHLRLATEAAPQSPWGRVLKVFNQALVSKTGGAYTIDFYFNATQGPETVTVDKLRAGKLDIVAVSSIGLNHLDPRLSAMQLPGVVSTWQNLDNVRAKMGPQWESYLNAKGVTLLTWSDVGYMHVLSNGCAVHTPADLSGHHPWLYHSEPNAAAIYRRIPGVTAFRCEIADVASGLQSGAIDALRVPALAAEMFGWNARVDHGMDQVVGVSAGAILISTPRLAAMPAAVQSDLLTIAAKMGQSSSGLRTLIRNEDAAAWTRFKARAGAQIYAPTAADQAAWNLTLSWSVSTLVLSRVYDAGLVAQVRAAAP